MLLFSLKPSISEISSIETLLLLGVGDSRMPLYLLSQSR